MREEAKKWFQQALEDLSTGHYYASAFWAQQSAEKALKALLIDLGKMTRTHDLNEILDEIQREAGIRGDEIRQDVTKLTVHYTIARYPDAANAVPARLYSKEDAEDLIRRAERVVEWVKRYLQ